MADLWQRLLNVKTEIDVIRDALDNKDYPWGFCCITLIKDNVWRCSRYELPEDEFREKCKKCKEEIRKELEIE